MDGWIWLLELEPRRKTGREDELKDKKRKKKEISPKKKKILKMHGWMD